MKPVDATPEDARLGARGRRAVHWLIGLHGVTSFCYGMALPYTSIFLSGRSGVGTTGVAVYFAASGAANLVVAVLLALGWVRPPRVALGLTGNALSAAGFLLLPAVGSLPAAAMAGGAVGAGQGCFLAAIIPIVSSMTRASDTRGVFALRYQVLNATFALGALAAGVLTGVLSDDVIPVLFVVNALGYIPIAGALLLTRRASEAGRVSRAAESAADGGLMRFAMLLRATLAVVVFELVAGLFAFSQLESTVPLVAYRLMDTGLGWIPAIVAVSVTVVVIAQRAMTKALEPRSPLFGLRVAVVLWVVGYLLVGASAFMAPPFGVTGLLVYAALFGLGECAYSCSFYPWMISTVPDSELTRVTALTNGMMGIGVLGGPAIGVVLATSGSAAFVWLALAALCSSTLLTTVMWRTRRVRRVAAV